MRCWRADYHRSFQAMILLTSGIYVTVNLLIDVAYPPARSQDTILMAIETLPEPSIPITTPFRPGLGFLTSDADHRRRHRLPCVGDCVCDFCGRGLRRTIRSCSRPRCG